MVHGVVFKYLELKQKITRRNDHVVVTGIVNEGFGVTRIGTLDNGALVTYSLADYFPPIFPEPEVISTSANWFFNS